MVYPPEKQIARPSKLLTLLPMLGRYLERPAGQAIVLEPECPDAPALIDPALALAQNASTQAPERYDFNPAGSIDSDDSGFVLVEQEQGWRLLERYS